jgi:hypothetical protein
MFFSFYVGYYIIAHFNQIVFPQLRFLLFVEHPSNIHLFKWSSYILNDLQMTKRDRNVALGKVELQLIAVSSKQMSDESMEVKVILKDMILDDNGIHKISGITR